MEGLNLKIALIVYELSLNSYERGNVWGEEIDARGIQAAFNKISGVEYCDILTINILRFRQQQGEQLNYDLALHFYLPTVQIEGAMNILFFQQYFEWEKHDMNQYLREFDFVMTPAHGVTKKYNEVIYFPLAVDPEFYKPVPTAPEFICDVAFVGNRRMRELESYNDYLLPATNYKLKIFGSGWDEMEGYEGYLPFWQGVLRHEDAAVLYSSAKVSLSIHGKRYREEFHLVTSRIFHSLSCGGVVVSDSIPILEELIPGGKGILYSQGGDQSARILQRLINDKDERDELSAISRQWIVDNHTWDHRVKHLLKKIKV